MRSTPIPPYMEPQWFFPLFVAMWLGISFLLSRLGGWATLARTFRATEPAAGERFHFASGSMGVAGVVFRVNYGSCLFVVVNDRGFHLSQLFLFRLGSPPLFIPWRAVESAEEERILFMRRTVIRLRNQWPTIKIHGKAGERIRGAYGESAR